MKMKVLLKNSLSLFGGNLSTSAISEGRLSTDIETLCGMVAYISGEKCTPQSIVFQIEALEKKNPVWYASINSMVSSIKNAGSVSDFVELLEVVNGAFANVIIDLRRCSLKENVSKGAKKKEHRTPFHVNIPDSRYKELTEPLILRLKAIREMEKSGKNEAIEGIANINVNVPEGTTYKRILKEIDLAMIAYGKETNGTGIIKNWIPLSDQDDIKEMANEIKSVKSVSKAFEKL